MNDQTSEDDLRPSRLRAFLAGMLFGALVGLLLGSLIGAGAMLLLAPRAGKQTRAKIQKQSTKLRHQATERMDDLVTDAGDRAHQFTDSVQKGVDDLQRHAQDMFDESKN
ncbi:MAG: YtxH domain-containing protein [Caldilineaceae bacterium]|mgnify:CR=1 FL=1|jgi:gas vesicle protein|nr:YtxH domain-containing protein [Caldilineaceae bacterium]